MWSSSLLCNADCILIPAVFHTVDWKDFLVSEAANTVIPLNPKIEGEAATGETNHAKRALNSWLKELNLEWLLPWCSKTSAQAGGQERKTLKIRILFTNRVSQSDCWGLCDLRPLISLSLDISLQYYVNEVFFCDFHCWSEGVDLSHTVFQPKVGAHSN